VSELKSGRRETGTGLESEQVFQIKFPYKAIYGGLAMLAQYLGQNQPGGVAVITATHLRLNRQQFACFLERHKMLPAAAAMVT
jgi:hypothetical protein